MICVLGNGHHRVTRSIDIASDMYVYVGKAWLDAWFYGALYHIDAYSSISYSMCCIAWLMMRTMNLSIWYTHELWLKRMLHELLLKKMI